MEKLAETAVQVASMKKVAEEKKVVVAQAKVDCEELLVEIVQVGVAHRGFGHCAMGVCATAAPAAAPFAVSPSRLVRN